MESSSSKDFMEELNACGVIFSQTITDNTLGAIIVPFDGNEILYDYLPKNYPVLSLISNKYSNCSMRIMSPPKVFIKSMYDKFRYLFKADIFLFLFLIPLLFLIPS